MSDSSLPRKMKALVVGAGAVGQVYGRHLQQGGAEVMLLVKPRHLEAAREGFNLYPLNRRRSRKAPVRFEAPVVSTVEEALAFAPDTIVLCVPSTGLREGIWLDALAAGLGEATVVALQPAPNDLAYVTARVPADQVVPGMIGIIAYAGPLPKEQLPVPGTAYWFPPFAPSAFGGGQARSKEVVRAFRNGGLPAVHRDNLPEVLALGAALLHALVLGLEAAGWSFARLRQMRPLLSLTHAAALEAVEAHARRLGRRPPLPLRLARPGLLRLGMRMAPRLVPFDLEAFLRAHFTKVSPQTDLWLEETVAIAAEHDLPTEALLHLGAQARGERA